MKKIIALAAVAAAAVAMPAFAQDPSQDPNFGTVRLSSGFTPDPRTVEVIAGGSIDASRAASSCVGMITDAPDVRVNWTGGSGGLPLIFSARSSDDTTLVINGPDGRWYCNDDTNGLNPQVSFRNAPTGQYDVWIGTFSEEPTMAVISISEVQ